MLKKVLWTIIILAIALGIIYLTTAKGNIGYKFFRFAHSGGFETFFDEASKEIASNPNLAEPAHFTVSEFTSSYENEIHLKNLIETEVRNSLSQMLPGRVTSYRNFTLNADEKKKADTKAAADKNKQKKAEDKKTDSGNAAGANAGQQAEDNPEMLKNSGNFIISGTYKEEDGTIIVNLYVSDAENGRGYYARRISIPEDKLPELFIKAEKKDIPAAEITIPAIPQKNIAEQEKPENTDNADNEQLKQNPIVEKISKAMNSAKQEKEAKKENAEQANVILPIPAPASDINENPNNADPLEDIGNEI